MFDLDNHFTYAELKAFNKQRQKKAKTVNKTQTYNIVHFGEIKRTNISYGLAIYLIKKWTGQNKLNKTGINEIEHYKLIKI